jgi:hypothetical protein
MENKLYTIAIDWTDGRTPVYESFRKWRTTEDKARKYFRKESMKHGVACALIGPDGRIMETVAAVVMA